jgi:hypothetical protein
LDRAECPAHREDAIRPRARRHVSKTSISNFVRVASRRGNELIPRDGRDQVSRAGAEEGDAGLADEVEVLEPQLHPVADMEGFARADDGERTACSKDGERLASDIDDFEPVVPLRMSVDDEPMKRLDAGDVGLIDIARGDGEEVYVTDARIEAS